MRIGISITSGYPGQDDKAAVDAVIERVKAAAEAGLDHLSLGDQHSTGRHFPYVANVPMIGRVMADWPQDRPVGLLLLLPLWHPVMAAEQIGTLAAMTNARFIIQTGIGSGSAQFAAMGSDLSARGRTSDRSIRTIKALLDGEVVTEPAFNIVEASVRPRPLQPPEWWIGAGMATAAIDRAAREGNAWYVSPGLDGDALRLAADSYREACSRHGTIPDIALRRDVLVGHDHTATIKAARAVIEAGYRGMDEQVIAGDPEHVAQRLAKFSDIGIDNIVARTITVDQPTALKSIELLGSVRELVAR
jgi:alkanesulfonate monooxygenase SsuD/methylene tetrahydromethanopterin reductase-like flavin-dependent oxidoreductase (luciferase family)